MRWLILLLLLLVTSALKAQYGESIRSGRPGQAIGPFTVGKYVFQVQSGVTFGREEFDDVDRDHDLTLFNSVIRYGITEHFEISGVLGISTNRENTEFGKNRSKGVSDAQLGFRFNIRDGQVSGPVIGIQNRLRLNILGDDFEQREIGTTTILIIGQNLTEKLGLTANLGITWGGNSLAPVGFYVLNLSHPIGEHISLFIENYGSVNSGDWDTRFDTGLGYFINKDLQLDFSAGYGKNDQLTDYFFDFGVSWRILTKPRD